jgi:hypothetical protein
MYLYGTYGNQYNASSVRYLYGDFGSSFSQYSAENSFAANPPEIYKYGTVIGYLTTNTLKTPRASLDEIDAQCSFSSTVEYGVPASLVTLSASQGTYYNGIDLTY